MYVDSHVYSGSNRIPLKIHECRTSSTIIINYPGYNGSIDGFENKYVKLAEHMVRSGLGTVVRMANIDHGAEEEYETTVQRDLRVVIEHMIATSGESGPAIYLIGTSAGGGAVAAVASSYPNVRKILLIAPSFNVSQRAVEASLASFTGEVSIVVGLEDVVTGARVAKYFEKSASKALDVRIVRIAECDHHFSGTKNGRILSQAPQWAFGDGDSFPDPTGGIELY